jgi:3'-phosphoadenosine 5'-phosphosulfate sulfotransferase (PAPS reductase)/FAD synthetase
MSEPLLPLELGRSLNLPPGVAHALTTSCDIVRAAREEYQPTHIVAMVSGGKDSALAYAVADDMGMPVDLILHGRTRTGIPQTTEFVTDHYGSKRPDFAVADAGDAYERYVMRKGFFGKGRTAHNFAYRILKADPFRAAVSRLIRKRQRGVRVMLLNGARKHESNNRRLNMPVTRMDKGNLWVNICHEWTAGQRDAYLAFYDVPINPVAKALCRSGECMCGTMQTDAERWEAAALYPEWGAWLADLERTVRRKHGWGWGDTGPAYQDPRQGDLFEPMCSGCVNADRADDPGAARLKNDRPEQLEKIVGPAEPF